MKFPLFQSQNKNGDLLATRLKNMIRNSIVLEREECPQEPSLGRSKIGGVPHLPAGFQWPRYAAEGYDGEWASRPLSFLAQIDLRDISGLDRENLLPARGHLYFFYEVISQKWGFEPEDEGCARVYYFDVPVQELCQTEFPDDLEEEAQVPLSALSFQGMDELPSYEEFCELTNENLDWEHYEETANAIMEPLDCAPEERCKLLGYGELIQGSMLEECARVTAGLSCGSPEDYQNISEEQKAAISQDKSNWILLAQFGTLSEEIMFGDCGCIYFYIRKDDLAAHRFDRAWLCLQCG